MAATGKTPILLYGSTTPTNAPVAGNLTNSSEGCEIAINVADKNLFFKDSTNTVNTVPIRQSSASSNGWLSSTDWSTFNGKQPAGSYALTTGTLAQFASTTSAQLAGVISDETGSGSLVFANTPTLVTPNLGKATATTITVANGNAANTVTGYYTRGNSDPDFRLGTANGAGTTVNSEQAKIGLYYQTGTTPLAHIGFIRGSGADSRGVSVNVNNVEHLRIDDSGNLNAYTGNLVIGTAGKGIDFSATPGTGTSELLADYEEGTFTVTRSGFTEAIGSGSITNTGKYIKIGNLVKVTITLTCAGGATLAAGSGAVASVNLPFTPAVKTSGTWCNSSSLTTAGSVFAQTNGNLYVVTGWAATESAWTLETSFIV